MLESSSLKLTDVVVRPPPFGWCCRPPPSSGAVFTLSLIGCCNDIPLGWWLPPPPLSLVVRLRTSPSVVVRPGGRPVPPLAATSCRSPPRQTQTKTNQRAQAHTGTDKHGQTQKETHTQARTSTDAHGQKEHGKKRTKNRWGKETNNTSSKRKKVELKTSETQIEKYKTHRKILGTKRK